MHHGWLAQSSPVSSGEQNLLQRSGNTCPEADILTFCNFAEKNSTAFKKKRKKIRYQTLQACVSFLVLFLGAQNAEHKTNPVLRSTLTESKVPVSHIPHLPGSLVQCVCINVANCVGFSECTVVFSF